MSNNEDILLVNKRTLFDSGKTLFQGTLFDERVVNYLEIISSHYEVMRRGAVDEKDMPLDKCAERNFNFKQTIPYIIITKGDKFYVTERLEGAGESRLHGKLSMGIGGHMNPIEGLESFNEILHENTLRELNEELKVESAGESVDIEMKGLLNDDSDEVGQVHIALLGKINLKENQNVTVKEVEQLKGSWYTLDELLSEDVFPRIESWGKIVVEAIRDNKI